MNVETKDILLKAAEDVQSGMWCKANWFANCKGGWDADDGTQAFTFRAWLEVSTERMGQSERCAEGSLIYATRLLGGQDSDYVAATSAVEKRLGSRLFDFNDRALPDDPFEAGQQLAELFRSTAERL